MKGITCLFLLLFLLQNSSFAQEEPEYDEVPIVFFSKPIGGIELTATIVESDIYLPVKDLFDFLKIKSTLSPGMDSVTGFFIEPNAPYLIDKANNLISFRDQIYELNPGDLIRTETNLYLLSDYFNMIFGLDCEFNFRSLSVTMKTRVELPVIREKRLEMMRKNINRLKGVVKADTVIGREYPFFHFGMLDWSVIATQRFPGGSDARFRLSAGTALAGGEANVTLNYSTREPFTEKQQHYLWRWVNNDFRAVRQVLAGKIATNAISSIYSPVVGVQVTNKPTFIKRAFGTYTLSDYTEPGWVVELYVNRVLVDYTKADPSGFYTFQVPLVYGTSNVMLRFYGPWGEEHSMVKTISIPYTFLQPGRVEYKVSGGIVEDGFGSWFSRAHVNYGLGRRLTVGGGVEYLSSIATGPVMPFFNFSLRLASSLLISGEFTHNVRLKGVLSYRTPSNIQLELYYTKYKRGQQAVNFNYLEERRGSFSIPFHARNFTAFVRLSATQIILQNFQYITTELLLSGSIRRVSTNLTIYGMFSPTGKPNIYSNLSLGFILPFAISFNPQVQFDFTQARFISMKFELKRQLFRKGRINISYEHNFRSKLQNLQIGFQYDFSFAQTGMSARISNRHTTLMQAARGNMIYDRKTRYLHFDRRTGVGKGGIVILPYLDLDCNGIRDPGEPKIVELNIRVAGGRIEYDSRDSTIRILDLEPYLNYFIELDRYSFDNVAWHIRERTFSVTVDPNQFKLVEVPVAVVGEAAGMVYIERPAGLRGQGRVIVNFYQDDMVHVSRVLSESDGYFSFIGLKPGVIWISSCNRRNRKSRSVLFSL